MKKQSDRKSNTDTNPEHQAIGHGKEQKKVLDTRFYFDPYKHFQNENDEIPVEVKDDYSKIKYNPESFSKYLDKYFKEMTDEKKPWLVDAMKHDPAFMLDPINDFYKKMIPRELLLNLDEKDIMDIVALYDPVTWGEKYLLQRHGGWHPRHSKDGVPYQSMMARTRARAYCGRAGRRCVIDDSTIQTMDGPMTALDLFNDRQIGVIHEILTMNEDTNQILPTSNYTIKDNGYDTGYRIETRTGHIDKMTKEHPYYTIRDGMPEWVEAQDLKPGDRIAVLKRFPLKSKYAISRNMSRLLGYLIADGSTSQKYSIGFTNADALIVEDMKKVANSFDCNLNHDGKYGYRLSSIWHGNNMALNAIRFHGMGEKLSIHKEIPQWIFISTKENRQEFISAMWDCDGWISICNSLSDAKHKTAAFEIGYCSSSEKLIYGLKHLLLTLGIVTTVKKKKVMYNGEYRHTFQLTIHDIDNALKFHQNIKLVCKQPRLEKVIELIFTKTSNNGKTFTKQTPRGLVNEIEKVRLSTNTDKRLLRRNENERYRTDGRNYSIDKGIHYAKYFGLDKIVKLLDNEDFYWDEIKSVECIGESHSYAITVPGTHTFIANDTITHNTGKSLGAVVRLLHKSFTWSSKTKPSFNIIIFTPNQAQIKMIFKMMEVLIDSHPLLMSMVVGGKIPTRSQPNLELELTNGVTIRGFVSGSGAIRGSAADILWMDEASFLSTDDTDAVVALLGEHPDVELIITSTPKGLKDWFFEKVYDPEIVSFHFPSDEFHPFWDSRMEKNFKANLSEAGYGHEVRAEFTADGEGVYQRGFIEAAKRDYEYEDQRPQSDMVYGMGVDWNDTKNGTQIKLVGFSMESLKYRIVASESVSIEGWTQTAAVEKIRDLNRCWRPAFIYVDSGHGGYQIETLHKIGVEANVGSPDRDLMNVKGVGSRNLIEIYDPAEQKKVQKQTKPLMIGHSVRVFENYLIEIPKSDVMLIHQMEGYRIDHMGQNNTPVYKADPKYGDHTLDATVLALFGFMMELSSLGKTVSVSTMQIMPSNVSGQGVRNNPALSDLDMRLAYGKEFDRKIVEAANATSDIFSRQTPYTSNLPQRRSSQPMPVRISIQISKRTQSRNRF